MTSASCGGEQDACAVSPPLNNLPRRSASGLRHTVGKIVPCQGRHHLLGRGESMSATLPTTRSWRLLVFVLLAVAGLFYVKWLPYYGRAFVAANQHSIGHSILMGDAASAPAPSWNAALGYALAYGKAIWQAMLLGLLLGSGIQALLPVDWVQRMLGQRHFGSVLAGGLLAVPGMMCTCCAAPVVVGLREHRASPGAAVAFWLGNTVLNPATLVFTGFVLGWHWTALRLLLGIPMVFGLGYVANRMAGPGEPAAPVAWSPTAAEPRSPAEVGRRWARIFGRMTLRLIPEYIVIVLLLGAVRAWMFPHVSPAMGDQWFWIVALALAGMLFVIPTAGEVPIVQAMLALGLGGGPAAALLLTLPPVSLPSLAMLGRSFPWRMLVVIAFAVVGFGILGGALAVLLGLH
ncbi:putative two-component membrane permease complex subunit [Dyella sp. AD56]|nr:putative two-component membrane permease complex subunit [Dyella sp. AD56]